MARTRVAVTKHLLERLLQVPADVKLVGVAQCPYDHCVDLVLDGPSLPAADRCKMTARQERMRYEFTAEVGNG